APALLPVQLGEDPTPTTTSPLTFRRPPTACTGPAQRQDRSSSLRCGRSVLTPVLTRRCLPGGRKPAKPLVDNVLTEPRPFSDGQNPPPASIARDPTNIPAESTSNAGRATTSPNSPHGIPRHPRPGRHSPRPKHHRLYLPPRSTQCAARGSPARHR